MNILILNWRDPKNPKSGGAEKVTLEHAKAWVKAGHQVTWFTSFFQNAKRQETINGIKIVRKGNAITTYLLAPFFYFSSGKYDTVIDEIHGIPYFTPLYVRGPKIVAFIHEVAGEIWDYMYPFPINAIGKSFEKIYFKFYKNIQFWTDAPSTIEELATLGINRSNCKYIECAVNNIFVNKLPEKEIIPTFIFVSRLVKMKGVKDIIESFNYISQVKTESQLWIVGDGEMKFLNELKNMASKYNIGKRVRFWGWVSEEKKLELMGKAHVLLHASVKEGWGLVVLEAASRGTPSVVYNVNGLKDVVINKKTGIILNMNNPKDMADRALWIIANKSKYKFYQNNALRHARSFNWSSITKKSLRLISN